MNVSSTSEAIAAMNMLDDEERNTVLQVPCGRSRLLLQFAQGSDDSSGCDVDCVSYNQMMTRIFSQKEALLERKICTWWSYALIFSHVVAATG